VRCSVLVTTYNKERELALVLEGWRHQSEKDFELIVADDGSGPETKAVIEAARRVSDFPIIHSWQEDDGFRAARSRNLAIRKARGKLIIMTDGDCVPFPGFLAQHIAEHRPGRYLAGERYLLSQEEASSVSPEGIASGAVFKAVPEGELKRVRTLRLKNRAYKGLRLKERPTVITANFAVARTELERINGFDERYEGWGHEDTDLGRRLRSIGVSAGNPLAGAECLHLWHKTESTFAGRVRDCANAGYFGRGIVLASCRAGLVARDFASLRIAVRSPDAALQEQAEGVLGGGAKEPAELAIVLLPGGESGAGLSFPKAEAQVLVLAKGARPRRSLLRSAGLLLGPGGQELAEGSFELFDAAELGAALPKIREILDRMI